MKKKIFSVFLALFPFMLLFVLRFYDGAWSVPLKFYPVLINLALLATFGLSLWQAETQVFRFATLTNSSVLTSPNRPEIERYCRKVTIVWCVFFIANGSAAAFTALFAQNWVWALYNGFIAYILMGTLFACEFLARKKIQRNLT
jgi:uncharacterized membrane protein